MPASRATPVARSIGAMMRSPASALSLKRGPVSYSSACARVCTSTARPCPTSSTVTRNAPGGGSSGATTNSGSSHTNPSVRPGSPRGASSQSTPITPATIDQTGGACCSQTAAGKELQGPSSNESQANTWCAATSSASQGRTIEASVNGTTMKGTTGIATALASGDTNRNL